MAIFRPGSRAKHTPPREITGIEQVLTAKLLGICFSDNLSLPLTLITLYLLYFNVLLA